MLSESTLNHPPTVLCGYLKEKEHLSSIRKINKLFQENCLLEGKEHVFCTSYNIKFYCPKKNVCPFCYAMPQRQFRYVLLNAVDLNRNVIRTDKIKYLEKREN